MNAPLATTLIPLFANDDPAGVKYNVALLTGVASLIVAAVGAVLAFVFTRKNQLDLARLQADLSAKGLITVEQSKAALDEAKQTRMEILRADLGALGQRELETLRAALADQKKEKDALTDYRYEAHKRLYQECEPLLFQLADFAAHALFRIYSLARTSRDGHLPDWLIGDGYYKRSTMYKLVAPLVILRLIQRRLTFVDLSLDTHIASQYALLRLLYLSFTDAFIFAQGGTELPYAPHEANWKRLRTEEPRKHWQQGLSLGALDNTMDALLTAEGPLAWLSYGEFEEAIDDPNRKVRNRLEMLADVLERFSPEDRPIFWRMLITQTLIYEKILESRTAGDGTFPRAVLTSISPDILKASLDWRPAGSGVSDEEAVLGPRRIAEAYLHLRMPAMFGPPGP